MSTDDVRKCICKTMHDVYIYIYVYIVTSVMWMYKCWFCV